MSWHCRQARWQKRWESFVLRLRLAMQWGERKVRILPPASKYAIVVSKANLPSNVHVICYKFCFSSVTRGQRVTDHILFGTPGTLLDWILRHRVIDSKKIKMFVLDEADVMIALRGHQDQSIRIHKSVNYCYRARSIICHQIFLEDYFQDYQFLANLRKHFLQNKKFRLNLGTNFLAWIIQVLSAISRYETMFISLIHSFLFPEYLGQWL